MRVVTIINGIILTLVLSVLTAIWVAWAIAAGGDAAKGKEIYAKSCASCHGTTGKGEGAAAAALNPKPKDLTDKAYVSKLDDKYLQNVISKGGAGVGKSPLMPPWSTFKDEDVQNLIAYIRSLGK